MPSVGLSIPSIRSAAVGTASDDLDGWAGRMEQGAGTKVSIAGFVPAYAEAEAAMEGPVRVYRRQYGDRHPFSREFEISLADVVACAGRLDEAEANLRTIVDGLRRDVGPSSWVTLYATSGLAGVLNMQHKYEEAESLALGVIPLLRSTYGDQAPDTLDALNRWAVALKGCGRVAEAERTLRELVHVVESEFTTGYYHLAEFRNHWGQCLTDLGHYEEAEVQLKAAYEGELATRGADHKNTRKDIANLMHLYDAWSKPDQAAAWRAKLPVTQPAATQP